VDGNDEIESGEDGRKSGDENGESGFHDFCIGIVGAERRVEGPAGVDAAGQHAVQHHHAADDVEIPAQQVDAGKGEVPRADHQGNEKISQDRGDGGNQEKEDHDHAVHGEKFVVSVGLHQVACGREQFEADEQGEESADEKEERNRDEVKQRDAFVVGGEQPRPHSVLFVQIIFALNGLRDRDLHTHCT
jgi:hypothetical protein